LKLRKVEIPASVEVIQGFQDWQIRSTEFAEGSVLRGIHGFQNCWKLPAIQFSSSVTAVDGLDSGASLRDLWALWIHRLLGNSKARHPSIRGNY
jgi:hypothetical protein